MKSCTQSSFTGDRGTIPEQTCPFFYLGFKNLALRTRSETIGSAVRPCKISHKFKCQNPNVKGHKMREGAGSSFLERNTMGRIF